MNIGDVKRRLKSVGRDQSAITIIAADIIDWINDAQAEIARRTKYYRKTTTKNTAAGTKTYSITDGAGFNATDFMFEERLDWKGYLLTRTTYQELDKWFPDRFYDNLQDDPEYYYLEQDLIYLYPVPSTVGLLTLYYIAKPAALTDVDATSLSVPAQMHEDAAIFCTYKLFERLQDFKTADRYLAQFEKRMALAISEVSSRDNASYHAVRTLPGDEGFWD